MTRRPTLNDLRAYFRVALSDPKLAIKTVRTYLSRTRRARKHAANQRPRAAQTGLPATSARKVVSTLSKSFAVLVLSNAKRTSKIGVSDTDFIKAVNALRQMVPHARIYIDGRRFIYNPKDFSAACYKAEKVSFAFAGSHGLPNLIDIEMYQRREDTLWVSVNAANTSGRAIYADPFRRVGKHKLETFLGGQTIEDKMNNMSVDVVVSWVNHADPDWQKLFEAHKPERDANTDASAITRFSNNDELRYCLRSVARYLPWVRRVHVVSNCAPPPWLNTEHERVIWVDHSELIPKKFLPNFNSHAIETFLHKLPNLSEHFIYFNDDMFACIPQAKNRFFNANETSCSFMESYGMVTGDVKDGGPDYLNASRNSAALLSKKLGYIPTQLHEHAPYALKRSVLRKIETDFAEAIEQTRRARFRAKSDINLTSFLYHHYAFWNAKASFQSAKTVMLRNTDVRWKSNLTNARKSKCEFLCINEGGAKAANDVWRKETKLFLTAKFPEPAPWEHS